METEQYGNIAEHLYRSALYMLDYDLDGLEFHDNRLLPYLTSTNDYILQQLSEEEFLVVVERFIDRWREESLRLKVEIQKIEDSDTSSAYMMLMPKRYREEQGEIAKLIQWTREEFTYSAVENIKKSTIN